MEKRFFFLWSRLIENRTTYGAHLVWSFVSQMMRTCNRLSPRAPRYCICQHARWSVHLWLNIWLKRDIVSLRILFWLTFQADHGTKATPLSEWTPQRSPCISIVNTLHDLWFDPFHPCTWTRRIGRELIPQQHAVPRCWRRQLNHHLERGIERI